MEDWRHGGLFNFYKTLALSKFDETENIKMLIKFLIALLGGFPKMYLQKTIIKNERSF